MLRDGLRVHAHRLEPKSDHSGYTKQYETSPFKDLLLYTVRNPSSSAFT